MRQIIENVSFCDNNNNYLDVEYNDLNHYMTLKTDTTGEFDICSVDELDMIYNVLKKMLLQKVVKPDNKETNKINLKAGRYKFNLFNKEFEIKFKKEFDNLKKTTITIWYIRPHGDYNKFQQTVCDIINGKHFTTKSGLIQFLNDSDFRREIAILIIK